MEIQDDVTASVANVLSTWNPLGADANSIPDLDGYTTEAADIIFELSMVSCTTQTVTSAVKRILFQAFGLDLTRKQYHTAALKIRTILKNAESSDPL